jgi:hypothetical protein
MKFLITWFLLAFCQFLCVRSKHLPLHPCLKTHPGCILHCGPCTSFTPRQSKRDSYSSAVSHSRREDRKLCTEWQQVFAEFNLLLIYLWIQLWFVGVIHKCLELSTYLKKLLVISVRSWMLCGRGFHKYFFVSHFLYFNWFFLFMNVLRQPAWYLIWCQ